MEWEPGAFAATSYRVRRDGTVKATVDGSTLAFEDTTVAAGVRYSYVVEAVGPGGSVASAQARVKTPSPPERRDLHGPTVPEDVHAIARADGTVLIDWQGSNDDSDVSAYLVRRDGRRLAVVDAGTLSYIDRRPGTAAGQYTVEAMDITGVSSGPSDVVSPGASGSAASGSSEPVSSGAASASGGSSAAAVAAFSDSLRRYPYLTDVVNSADGSVGYATINWATLPTSTTATALWGAVDGGGGCTPTNVVSATRTGFQVNSVTVSQWEANLTLLPDREYCYRVTLGGVDMLGTDPSPRFRTLPPTGSTAPFSFAVLGDWGEVDSTSGNPDQANVMQQIAASGVSFALTTGDNAYSSGSQTNYGDLVETGPGISAVFGPQYWAVPGRSVPLFPSIGNHGFLRSDANHPHMTNWPQDRAVAESNGRYQRDTYCCLLGTASLSLPSTWYAFDAGRARIYVLQATWSDSNGGVNNDPYEVDAAYQWTPTSPQYQWLQSDLAAHPDQIKMVAFHYPLYSDQRHETSDTFLHAPGSLQGLLNDHGVKFAFNGHAHIYQRNFADSGGMVSYVTGGGGAKTQSVAEDPCLAIDAYAIGWSNSSSTGNSCGAATPPTSRAQVFHFLKVTVDGSQVTVTPINSLGQSFDVQTYDVGPPPPTDSEPPSVPTGVGAVAASATQVDVTWSASTDNVGVTGYDVLRDGVVVGSVGGSTLAYSDTTVTAATTYGYQVVARDLAANASLPSSPPAVVTTPTLPGPVTVGFVAVEDGYVDATNANANFGSATTVAADTSPLQRGFLKFRAEGITGQVQTAVVRLWVTDSTSNAPQLANTTSAWSEGTLTWNAQPAAGSVVADLGSASTNTFIEYPVTASVGGNGTYSFELIPQSSNGLGVASSEAISAGNRPQLVVTYLPAEDGDTGAPSAPTGVSAAAASSTLVNVAWSAASDDVGVTGYDILRDGAAIASVGGSALSYADAAVSPLTTYTYRVVAKDLAGHASAASDPAVATTPRGPVTISSVAVEDAYTDARTTGANFGTGTALLADTSPAQRSYLKFVVTGITGTVQRAVVRMWVTDSTSNAPQLATTASTWTETGLTWSNQPAPGTVVGDLGSASRNSFIEYPVTAVVTSDGTYSFVLVPQSSNGLGVASREAASVNRPQLVVTFD